LKFPSVILSLFLFCSCADGSVDSFSVAGIGSLLRPAQNFPLGADSVLGYGGGTSYEDPMDHYWDFEPDDADDDYLWQNNIDALEATTYTLVAVVTYEALITEYIGGMRTGGVDESYFLYVVGGPEVRASTARNDCSTMSLDSRADGGWGAGTSALVALTFEYSGNAGVGDSTKKIYVIRAGSVLVDTDANSVGPINDCTGQVYIAAIGALTTNAWDGKIYWWAYYDSALAQGDLEDLFDGTKHPAVDFTPIVYVDFSKAVDATYAPEVGAEHVFTVVGSPVQGP